MPLPERYFSKIYANGNTFHIGVLDLLSASVDAIVNPANSGLSHGGGLAAVISDQAGPGIDRECARVIEKVGHIPTTLAVPTKAYNLPFKGIIHAVGPRMGDGDEISKEERTIINSLIVAEKKGWQSVAFPALGTGIFRIPKKICAEAFNSATDKYWASHPDSTVNNIWLCLTLEDFPVFKAVIGDYRGIA